MQLFESDLPDDSASEGWYVTREDVRTVVADRISWSRGAPSSVVVFHGPGGVGKTIARKMLERGIIASSGAPYVVVDYEPDSGSLRSCEATFGHIRRRLGQQKVPFPTFDLIWARYWEETTHQRLSPDSFPSELGNVANVVSLIPLLGNVPAAIAGLIGLGHSGAEWLSRKFEGRNPDGLRQADVATLIRLMPEAIACDLESAMEDGRFRGVGQRYRISIIFDAYERLAEHGVDDSFLREFCRRSGSVLKVVFGREPLDHWVTAEPRWAAHLDHRPPLQNFGWNDSVDYLRRRGVLAESLHQQIFELTNGFPYFLALSADLISELLRTNQAGDFASILEESASTGRLGEALLDRILRQLSGDEYDAVGLASIPRQFSTYTLEALLSEPSSAPRLFNAVTRFSFCQELPSIGDTYLIRKEARRLIRARYRLRSNWTNWNAKLMTYYKDQRAITEGGGDQSIPEYQYHHFELDPNTALTLFDFEFCRALSAWRFDLARSLLQAIPEDSHLSIAITSRFDIARAELLLQTWDSIDALNAARDLTIDVIARDVPVTIRSEATRVRGAIEFKLGNIEEAIELLSSSVQTLPTGYSRAIAFRAMGEAHYAAGNGDMTLDAYTQALACLDGSDADTLSQAGARAEDWRELLSRLRAYSLKGEAGFYARTGRLARAIDPLVELLANAQSLNDEGLQIETLGDLGLVYRRLNFDERAKESYTQAIEILALAPSPVWTGHIQCGLGMVLEQTDEIAGAERHFALATEAFGRVGDPYGMAKMSHCDGRIRAYYGDHTGALTLYEAALRKYREVQNIPATGALFLDIAWSSVAQGDLPHAPARCRQAIEVYSNLGDRLGVGAAQFNLGSALSILGDHAAALEAFGAARAQYRLVESATYAGTEPRRFRQSANNRQVYWIDFFAIYSPDTAPAVMHFLDELAVQ